MIKEAICTGLSVEEALDSACAELGLERGDVEFDILENPVKKTFGIFGGKPAKVRAYINEPDKTPADIAKEYLTEIFGHMGLNSVAINVEHKQEENRVVLNLSGDSIGFLIGRRGEVLDSLQYLVSLAANKFGGNYCRITIDSGNFREKRENTLKALARRIAINATKYGRSQSLEPMNPYDRRIIHTAVHSVRGANSWSMGDEPSRYVVIGPASKGEGYDAPRAERSRPQGGYSNDRRPGPRPGGPHPGGPRGDSDKGGYNRDRGPRDSRPGDRGPRREPYQKPAANPNPQRDKSTVPLYGKVAPKE